MLLIGTEIFRPQIFRPVSDGRKIRGRKILVIGSVYFAFDCWVKLELLSFVRSMLWPKESYNFNLTVSVLL